MKRIERVIRNHTTTRFALKGLAACVMLAFGANVHALPAGGAVSAGSASIAGGSGTLTVNQSSQNVAINWQSFSIGASEAVNFVQPNASSVALNRVLGADPSSILGSLSANGKVFLVNPNGILFGQGAQVNVGGLVASTRGISDADFMAGIYKFSGNGGGSVVNRGSITAADGGYVALLGASISNEGLIAAKLGTVALAAGNAFTLDVAGDGLLNVAVSEGAVNALVDNGGLIRADGGHVLLTAMAAGNLLNSAVNNTGVIQAQTIQNRNGTIRLMGDMQIGTVNVGGTLDASAPNGGNGGFIETSAAHVYIANGAAVSTVAPMGQTGTWLIDPVDFTVGSAPGDNITGAQLSANLVDNNITITTVAGPGAGNGDIFITEPVAWDATTGASALPTTLTLNALRNVDVGRNNLGVVITTAAISPTDASLVINAGQDVNIFAAITTVRGNVVVCCGQDINVNAALTATNGSILLSAGRDVNVVRSIANPLTAVTVTDGNMEFCAGEDVVLTNTFNPGGTPLMTLTRGSNTAGQDLATLGVPLGMTLSAGNAGTGPGVAGGTVTFTNGGLGGTFATVTAGGPGTPVNIFYNPVTYATPTDYSLNFTGNGGPVTSFMLVFPDGASKTFDGTTTATFTGLKGVPAGVTLGGAGVANFDTAAIGLNKTVSFTGFTLGGADANRFAFANSCCGPIVGRTTANIIAAPIVVAPAIVPPVVAVVPGDTLGATASWMPFIPFAPLQFAGMNLTVVDAGIPPMQLVVLEREAPVAAPPAFKPPPAPAVVAPPAVVVPRALPPRRDRN